jgi:hypothetical protein
VRTPHPGIDISHRVALLFTGDPARESGWRAPTTPRAKAEKRLDSWLTHVLPDPRKVRCEVRRVGSANSVDVTLDDLDLAPLDVLALADAATTPQESELEQRIRYAALGSLPAQTTEVEIVFARQPGWAADDLGYPEVLAIARAARNLVGGARPLVPQDLCEPQLDAGNYGGVLDTAELATRADAAVAGLDAAGMQLASTLGTVTTGTIDDLRTVLLAASLFGVPGAIPSTRRNTAAALAQLKDQAAAVLKELERRSSLAHAYDSSFSRTNAAPVPLREHLLGLFEQALGPGFVALPRFAPPTVTTGASGLTQVLGASLVPATEAPAIPAWVQRLTHVRAGVARSGALDDLRRLIGRKPVPATTLGQLPFTNNDRWVALESTAANGFANGRVAFALELPTAYSGAGVHSGLMLDEWPERIPVAAQTTGLAFNYDQPNAMAPQTLLLAVCPDERDEWDEDLLAAVVWETLDFVRQRSHGYGVFSQLATIPASIPLSIAVPRLGQVLPALYFAFNPSRDAVSAEFIDLN